MADVERRRKKKRERKRERKGKERKEKARIMLAANFKSHTSLKRTTVPKEKKDIGIKTADLSTCFKFSIGSRCVLMPFAVIGRIVGKRYIRCFHLSV